MSEITTITQRDIELTLSNTQRVKIKLRLLDEDFQAVDNMEGYVTKSSISIDASSNIRRVANISMYVPDQTYLPVNAKKIWTNSIVRIYAGIYDSLELDQYRWYLLGTMLMTDVQYEFAIGSQTLTLKLVDMMASTTSERGSQMGTKAIVQEGSNVRNALIAAVALFSPYKHYSVVEFDDTIPYDIETEVGNYPYDLLKKILDLWATKEMFYDKAGMFTVDTIPTGIGDAVAISSTVIDPLIIRESGSNSFSNVKNTTEIWGRELDSDYAASTCTNQNGVYNLYVDETFETLEGNKTFAFVADADCVASQQIKIQDTTAYTIYTQSGIGTFAAITAGAIASGRMYSVKYLDQKFILQGESTVHVIVQEITAEPSVTAKTKYKSDTNCNDVKWVVNADSPFAAHEDTTIHQIMGEIRQVLSGGEFDSIYTTALATERAAYENWLKTRWQDTVTITMKIVPWMDVNQKIQFTSPSTGTLGTYLVQKIDMDLNAWTMTVQCQTFYPVYPF